MNNFPVIPDHIIAFLFGFALPVVSGIRSARVLKTLRLNDLQRRRFYFSNSFFLWAITLIILLNWMLFSRSAGALGITKAPLLSTTVIMLSFGFIILYLLDSVITIKCEVGMEGKKPWTELTPFLPIKKSHLPAYTFMCITAGICEEIIFRGFLVTYAKSFFENDYPAVIIPAAVFAVAHFYQGIIAVIKIFILSVIFGFIFLRSGSLWIVMFLHFAIDFAGGFIYMKYQNEIKETEKVTAPPGEVDDNRETKEEG